MKVRDFVKGKTIESVEHPPRTIILRFTDGSFLTIRAFANGWEVDAFGLDFYMQALDRSNAVHCEAG